MSTPELIVFAFLIGYFITDISLHLRRFYSKKNLNPTKPTR